MIKTEYFIGRDFPDQDPDAIGPFVVVPVEAFSRSVKEALVRKGPGTLCLTRHIADNVTTVAFFEIVHCCRLCGCTENEACYDEIADASCHWVEADLCSACAGAENADG